MPELTFFLFHLSFFIIFKKLKFRFLTKFGQKSTKSRPTLKILALPFVEGRILVKIKKLTSFKTPEVKSVC